MSIITVAAVRRPDEEQASADQTPTVSLLPGAAKKQLQDKLASAVAIPLQVIDVGGAPLEISDPKATSIKIEGNYDNAADPVKMINDYVTKLRFKLVNSAARTITGLGLEFTNTQENNTFYLYYGKEEIDAGKSRKYEIPFMAVTGDPAYLSVQVVGAQFRDGSTWGDFPFPRPRRSSAPSTPATAPNTQQVDSKPRVLNSVQPRYTEDARKNHVLGTVAVRLLVGDDGAVKRVKVTNALPDGLTEQAIRSAYELKFEPARKDGKPVAYWMPVMVEFNLK